MFQVISVFFLFFLLLFIYYTLLNLSTLREILAMQECNHTSITFNST